MGLARVPCLGRQSDVGCRGEWALALLEPPLQIRRLASFSGTNDGLDVHALPALAYAGDEHTGQVKRARSSRVAVTSWIGCTACGPGGGLPREADPAGFGLPRSRWSPDRLLRRCALETGPADRASGQDR